VNDLRLVMRAADLLAEGGFRVWLFGGWAEELHGLRPPGAHADVDLLYPAPDFRRLDEFLAAGFVAEWAGKRRPYKRAFELDGVPIELLLVERDAGGWFTDFDAGRHRWPANVFARGAWPPVASADALQGYRAAYRSLHARAA
jgi:hypothetical protein